MGNCFRRYKITENLINANDVKEISNETSNPVTSSLKVPDSTNNSTSKDISTLSPKGGILPSPHLKSFTFSQLSDATENFRPDNLLGEGGFGNVYKGFIHEETLEASRPGTGMVVAVKKLKPEGFQGHKEWLSEVIHLGQLHHTNLVKLIGYCLDGDKRLLVYEFMSKGSLENHLFRKGAQPLPWELRIKVAIGAARGLAFLHEAEQPVIYRDFKASNILLDSEFNAKLADFGLAKAGPTGGRSHITTQVMGTQGYAAPEYLATGRLTPLCDVYSFGVVLLELLSGRHAMDEIKGGRELNLVDWAKPCLGDKRRIFRIMDTKLEGQYPRRGAFQATVLALQCISDVKFRPPMSEVLAALEKILVTKSSSVKSDQTTVRESRPQAYGDLTNTLTGL